MYLPYIPKLEIRKSAMFSSIKYLILSLFHGGLLLYGEFSCTKKSMENA